MRVAVLGCGPAGLLAAHAAAQYRDIKSLQIFSHPRKPSRIGGAQYLHTAIPGLTLPSPDGKCIFVKKGLASVYAEKVYGDPMALTSWDSYEEGQHDIWNLREAYHLAWRLYSQHILELVVDQRMLMKLMREYDFVISAIPAPSICFRQSHHRFHQQSVYISTDDRFSPEDMTVVWNGDPKDRWYRGSRIFNTPGVEWGDWRKVPEGITAVHVKKPLKTDCTCWADSHLLRVGRYGTYRKKVLAHEAYFNTEAALNAMLVL